jgi:hypothetical protein
MDPVNSQQLFCGHSAKRLEILAQNRANVGRILVLRLEIWLLHWEESVQSVGDVSYEVL